MQGWGALHSAAPKTWGARRVAADGQTGAGMSLGRRGGGGGLEAERSPAAPACSSVGKKRGQCGFGGPRIRLPPGL